MDIKNVSNLQNIQVPNATSSIKDNQPKVDHSDPVDTVTLSSTHATEQPKGSTAKKIGVGIASALYPGLGQLANGDVKKGAKFFFGQMASDIGFSALAIGLASVNPALGLAFGIAGGLAHAGIAIGSIVDAAKNA